MKLLTTSLLLLATLSFNSLAALAPAPGGEPSQGLVTRIELYNLKYKVGEPIPVRYMKTNVSAKPLTLWHSGFWPNHRIRVCDQFGELAPMTEQGKLRFNAFAPKGDRDKNFPTELAPKKEDATEGAYNLLELYDLKKPGIYSIQYVYEEYQTGWQGQVWSNVLVVEIADK